MRSECIEDFISVHWFHPSRSSGRRAGSSAWLNSLSLAGVVMAQEKIAIGITWIAGP